MTEVSSLSRAVVRSDPDRGAEVFVASRLAVRKNARVMPTEVKKIGARQSQCFTMASRSEAFGTVSQSPGLGRDRWSLSSFKFQKLRSYTSGPKKTAECILMLSSRTRVSRSVICSPSGRDACRHVAAAPRRGLQRANSCRPERRSYSPQQNTRSDSHVGIQPTLLVTVDMPSSRNRQKGQ